MGFQSEAMEEASWSKKEEAMEDNMEDNMEVEASGEEAKEVVHVCHVSVVACQFVIFSCVIFHFCSNGG